MDFMYDDFTGKIKKVKGGPTFTRSFKRKTPEQIDKLRATQLKKAEKLKTPSLRKERTRFIKSRNFDKAVRGQVKDYRVEFKKVKVTQILNDPRLNLTDKQKTALGYHLKSYNVEPKIDKDMVVQRNKKGKVIYKKSEALPIQRLQKFLRSKNPEKDIKDWLVRTKEYKNIIEAENYKKKPKGRSLKEALDLEDRFYAENKDLILSYNDNPEENRYELEQIYNTYQNERADLFIESALGEDF